MPPVYSVAANVIDINVVIPKKTDIFLVDTNVWFWMTYPAATVSASSYQTTDYPNFLSRVLNSEAKLLRSNFSLSELSHVIENTEHEIFKSYVEKLTLKEYRHNKKDERERIAESIDVCWKQVVQLADLLSIEIDDNIASLVVSRLKNEKVDVYDLFILEAMKKYGVSKVITDDGDFCTVPGIEVYTANRSVVRAARLQNRLVVC